MKNQQILCFGPADWWHRNPSCTTHLMRAFSLENEILYVNPFSTDLPTGFSAGLWRRIVRKGRSLATALRRVSPGFHTFSPLFLPVQGNPTLDGVNNAWIWAQLRAVLRWLHFRPTLIWYENVRAAAALDWFPSVPSIYHVSDAFAESRYLRDEHAFRALEEALSQRTDVMVCVSERLYEEKRRRFGERAHLIPHAVDFALFSAAARASVRPAELAEIPRPIAGYYGTLSASNDLELLEYCARSLPDVSFVFAGVITGGDFGPLQALPNTHFLGFLPYERMPALAAAFDVCLLPWRMTRWIEHCNPLKFMEFMAAGKPVVSVPIPQVASAGGDLVQVASGPEEFSAAIRKQLKEDTSSRQLRRMELASRHTLERHVARFSAILDSILRDGKETAEPTRRSLSDEPGASIGRSQ